MVAEAVPDSRDRAVAGGLFDVEHLPGLRLESHGAGYHEPGFCAELRRGGVTFPLRGCSIPTPRTPTARELV